MMGGLLSQEAVVMFSSVTYFWKAWVLPLMVVQGCCILGKKRRKKGIKQNLSPV
jgi:hypothetical protein